MGFSEQFHCRHFAPSLRTFRRRNLPCVSPLITQVARYRSENPGELETSRQWGFRSNFIADILPRLFARSGEETSPVFLHSSRRWRDIVPKTLGNWRLLGNGVFGAISLQTFCPVSSHVPAKKPPLCFSTHHAGGAISFRKPWGTGDF